MSSSLMLPEKGLENLPGQNNCFLNVCIQSLWHLGAFRSQFLTSKDHVHKENSCIYCALKILFNGYQFSDEQVLPPTALRNTLAVLHRGLDRFQVGELDDAAEALEAILTCLNKVYLVKGNERARKADESNPNSISNKVFGCPVVEIVHCGKCKKEIKPQGSDSFIYYTYVTEIREEHKKHPDLQFDRLLKKISDGVTRSCPNDKCEEKKCSVSKVLLQQPHVFAVGLVWSTPNPTPHEIVDMLSIISQQIRLSNIFNGVPVQFTYRLKGMICYYGLHYDCYFYSPQRKQWLVFDDRVVKEVGASWEQLKDRCRRGHFHPSVLFYERVETGAPLPTTFTPKFNPQPITLNRNMFTAAGPTVPGFALASPSGPYPGMQHPSFSPYHHQHPAFPQGYVPAYAHPQQQQHPHNGMLVASPQQPLASAQQQQQQKAENDRKQEMADRAEAERRLKQKEAEAQQQQQKEAEEKRRQEEELQRQQHAAAAASVQSSDDEEDSEAEDSSEEEEEGESGEENEREAAAKRIAAEQQAAVSRVEPTRSLPAPLVPTSATAPVAVASPAVRAANAVEPGPRSTSPSAPSLTGSSSSVPSGAATAWPSAPPLSPLSFTSNTSPSPISSASSTSPLPVMVEDLLSTEDALAVSSPVLPLHHQSSKTTTNASARPTAPYTSSFSSSTSAAQAVPSAPQRSTYSDYSELNFPSAPTHALTAAAQSTTQAPSVHSRSSAPVSEVQQPSIISGIDSYNDYSSKIDSIGQSKYLALSKPTYGLSSSTGSTSSTYGSRPATSSLFPSSSATTPPSSAPLSTSRPSGTFSLSSTSTSSSSTSSTTKRSFGYSAASSSSSSSSASTGGATAARKKPQTKSAFTNLSSLLSN